MFDTTNYIIDTLGRSQQFNKPDYISIIIAIIVISLVILKIKCQNKK